VFAEAASTGEATSAVADRLARERIRAARPAPAKLQAPPQKAHRIALAG
jgi:hypothetical protein